MEAPGEVEVEPEGVQEVGADPVCSLVGAGQCSFPSISAT